MIFRGPLQVKYAFEGARKAVPAYKLLPGVSQAACHATHPYDTTRLMLLRAIAAALQGYPNHTLWLIFGLSTSEDEGRKKAVDQVLSHVKGSGVQSPAAVFMAEHASLCKAVMVRIVSTAIILLRCASRAHGLGCCGVVHGKLREHVQGGHSACMSGLKVLRARASGCCLQTFADGDVWRSTHVRPRLYVQTLHNQCHADVSSPSCGAVGGKGLFVATLHMMRPMQQNAN